MANGWDSKNVQAQQDAQQDAQQPAKEAEQGTVSTAASKVFRADQDHAAIRADGDRKRRIQELELQRERILSERTSSPHRRNALEIALGEIERLLQELGYSLKL
jgi:hypothetical protein